MMRGLKEIMSLLPSRNARHVGQTVCDALVTIDAGLLTAVECRGMRRSSALALPSQPTPIWREQVGLPIVEGLAHGCTIVTTTESGLAAWLAAHGHSVIAPGSGAKPLADALVAALQSERGPEAVTADLPAIDGRLAADAWMFTGAG